MHTPCKHSLHMNLLRYTLLLRARKFDLKPGHHDKDQKQMTCKSPYKRLNISSVGAGLSM